MVRLYLLHQKNQKGSKELSPQFRKQPVAVSRRQRSKPTDHSHYPLTCLPGTVSTVLCTPGRSQKCGANKAYLISIKSFLKTTYLLCPLQSLSSCPFHCPCPFTFLSSSVSSLIHVPLHIPLYVLLYILHVHPLLSQPCLLLHVSPLSFLFHVPPLFTLP